MRSKGMIDIVIPTISSRKRLLARLLKSIPYFYEKFIMDCDRCSLAKKRNWGASKGESKYILFVDDDNRFPPRAIARAFQTFDHHKGTIGIVGFMGMYHNRRTIVCDGGNYRNFVTGFITDLFVNKSWPNVPAYDVDEVSNAFMVRRDIFEELGGFDEESFPIDLDEADLCARVKKAGYRVVVQPYAQVFHKTQTYGRIPDFRRTKNAYYMGRNKILFQKKHGHVFIVYLLMFLPITVLGYVCILLFRGKFNMARYFMWGVLDGLRGKKGCIL